MKLQSPIWDKVKIHSCRLVDTPTKKRLFTFFVKLGKGCGIISCKCFNMTHDLTKLQWVEKGIWTLKCEIYNNERRYYLILNDYAPPKLEQWIVPDNTPRFRTTFQKVAIEDIPSPQKVSEIGQKTPNNPIPQDNGEEQVDVNEYFKQLENFNAGPELNDPNGEYDDPENWEKVA